MKWDAGFPFSSWGQAFEYLFPLFMGLMVFFTYHTEGGVGQKLIYALIVAFITWILTALVRWTFVWISQIFKQ